MKEYLYTPFGEMWVEQNVSTSVDVSSLTRFFTNQMYDKESGLYFYNSRYYDPHLGSFISPDPGMSGSNHYGYCSANPIKYTDPTGLVGEGAGGATGDIAGDTISGSGNNSDNSGNEGNNSQSTSLASHISTTLTVAPPDEDKDKDKPIDDKNTLAPFTSGKSPLNTPNNPFTYNAPKDKNDEKKSDKDQNKDSKNKDSKNDDKDSKNVNNDNISDKRIWVALEYVTDLNIRTINQDYSIVTGISHVEFKKLNTFFLYDDSDSFSAIYTFELKINRGLMCEFGIETKIGTYFAYLSKNQSYYDVAKKFSGINVSTNFDIPLSGYLGLSFSFIKSDYWIGKSNGVSLGLGAGVYVEYVNYTLIHMIDAKNRR